MEEEEKEEGWVFCKTMTSSQAPFFFSWRLFWWRSGGPLRTKYIGYSCPAFLSSTCAPEDD